MDPRVRLGLNVGVTEVTEEAGFEVLVSSFTDSAVDALIGLVMPESETTKTKKK